MTLPSPATAVRAWIFPFLLSSVGWSQQWTQLQFEGRGDYTFRDPIPYAYPASGSGYQLGNYLSAICCFSEDLSLLVDQRAIGISDIHIFPERRYQTENFIYSGLRYTGNGLWQAGFSTDLLSNAKASPAPYLPASMTVTPEMLYSADASWIFAADRFRVAAATTWFQLNYDLKPRDPFSDPFLSDSVPYGARHDVDVWNDFSVNVFFGNDFSIDAGGRYKSDLSGDRDYDIVNYCGGISGTHRFDRNRFHFEWIIRESFIQSPVMKSHGYAVGPATEFSSKLLWRIRPRFFLKGFSRIRIGNRLAKQLYEAQLRRTWRGGSSVDFGYSGAYGTIFPRHGARLGADARISDHFGVSPEINVYFMRVATETSVRFYRADTDVELQIRLRERFEFFAGGGYRLYDRHPLFSTRTTFFSGIRTW